MSSGAKPEELRKYMSNHRRRSGQLLVALILSSWIPPLLAADSPASMSQRLVELGLQIELQIELAQDNLERGTLDQATLKQHAEEAAAALDGLEGQLHGLPDGTRDPLLAKLESVKAQAENLALAAELGSAPPRRGAADSDISHLDRGDHRRAIPDDCGDAFVVGLGSYAGDTTNATNDGEAVCGASLYSPDVWYRFVPTTSGLIVVEAIGSSYDTVLSVHSGCPGTMSNQLACNDDSVGLQSVLSFDALVGNEYWIRVSGANGAAGAYVITLVEGGRIEGTVTETGTGLPINTRVEIFDETGYQVGSTSTDAAGLYQVANLEAVGLFVATDGSNVLNELYDDLPCPNGGGGYYGCDVSTGDAVQVVAGAVTSGIDFVLDSVVDDDAVIAGVVQSEQTGLPLAGIRINRYSEAGSYLSRQFTDSSGQYRFGSQPEGAYYLVATHDPCRDELYDDIPCQGGPPDGCSFNDGTLVQATLNTTTSGIDFSLATRGVIQGTVIDKATTLPIDAIVHLHDDQGVRLKTRIASSAGAYVFGGLDDGTYFLTADDSSYQRQLFEGIDCPPGGCQVLTGTPVVIVDQSMVTGIDFDLAEKGKISGTVIDQTTSMPIQGVGVRAYDSTGSLAGGDSTGSAGVFFFYGLDAGAYTLAALHNGYVNELHEDIPFPNGTDPTEGTPVAVISAQTTTAIDFSLIPKGKITGSVTAEDGSGGVQMNMFLYDSAGSFLRSVTSSGGEYTFYSVDDGEYFVVAVKRTTSDPYLGELFNDVACWGGPPEGCSVTDGTPITAAAGTVTSGIDFVVGRGGTISGIVLDEVDGTPAFGRVYANDATGSETWYGDLSSGAYAIEGLPPGDFFIIADTDDHIDEVWSNVACAGEYPGDCDIVGAVPVTLGLGSEATIDFSLQRLATLSGTVRSAEDGSPLSGFKVYAFDEAGYQIGYYDYTDSSGRYDINRLYPATLFVATNRGSADFVDQLFDDIDCSRGPFDGCDPTTGTPVVVGANVSLEGIDFNLRRTGSISGQVTDDTTGLPMSGIIVELWDTDGDYLKYDLTDAFGRYGLHGLGTGPYFVATDEFYTSGTHLDVLYEDIPCPTGPPVGCDPTKGTPVSVALGTTTRYIDLALPARKEGIAGMVSSLETGEPIPGIYIDFWDADTGAFELSALTSPAGTFTAQLDPGTYVAATFNSGDWIDQIFDGIPCSGGSAIDGDCDPLLGTSIIVEENELILNIDFLLRPNDRLFSDGFESGDTTIWSKTRP